MTCQTCNGSGVDTRRADGSSEGKLVAVPLGVAHTRYPACPDCGGGELDGDDVRTVAPFFIGIDPGATSGSIEFTAERGADGAWRVVSATNSSPSPEVAG